MAVGHTILVIIYHIVRDGTVYEDIGPHYTVTLEPRAA